MRKVENEFLETWNRTHRKHFHGTINYDDWLTKEPFYNIIKNENGKFLDLGCGQGNNTLFLTQLGKDVLSVDLSTVALNIVKENIPNSKTMQLDMSKSLPFKDNEFDIIVSDLSLQYFDKVTTFKIIDELSRVIKNKGYLILRLSSINDVNYGAIQGKKLEEHYYFVEKRNKRYYDENDIRYFFNKWNIIYIKEEASVLQRYEYERDYFIVLVQNIKRKNEI